jgi:CRISPR-associated protein Csd1
MILQALKAYYDRKAADPESGIAPEGWEWKEIPFVVVLNEKGGLLEIEDTREGAGSQKRGKVFLIPHSVKKSVNIAANLLWGTPDYIFGIGDRRGIEKKEAFFNRINNELPDTDKKSTLLNYLLNINLSVLEKSPHWANITKTQPNMSFRFKDENEFELYCQSTEIKQMIDTKSKTKDADGICLITGERDKISRIHFRIKGVSGAKTTGADIVSFQANSGYDSYGKRQGYNAPIGEAAMFAYTTALNSLLDWNSKQRMQIGDATTVFWSAEKTQFEEDFAQIFSEPRKNNKDDPDAGTERIKNLFDSPKGGGYVEDSGKEKFYILGLAPNAARISIRFWKEGTVAEFAKNIRQHFIDLKITKSDDEPRFYTINQLLKYAASLDDKERIPPVIAGDFMCSILDGTPYPETLLQLVLRRIKNDKPSKKNKRDDRWGAYKPVRISLVKAILNRYIRKCNSNEKEFMMELDREQKSVGYRLGQIFALLERIQEKANPKINTTIRERYYGSACCTPGVVFPTLLKLKNHHIAKLKNKGDAIFFEQCLQEVMKPPFDEFPLHMNLYQQGQFAIGYYHQRYELFNNKDKKGVKSDKC